MLPKPHQKHDSPRMRLVSVPAPAFIPLSQQETKEKVSSGLTLGHSSAPWPQASHSPTPGLLEAEQTAILGAALAEATKTPLSHADPVGRLLPWGRAF